MNDKKKLLQRVEKVIDEQLFAVLSTTGPEGLHSVIVSFAASGDFREIYFFTPRQTRKFSNIRSEGRASLFIDNRSNRITDTQRTLGIEVAGRAEEVEAEGYAECLKLYTKKYPEMSDFAAAETTAAVKLIIERFEVVQHFQDVTILEPS